MPGKQFIQTIHLSWVAKRYRLESPRHNKSPRVLSRLQQKRIIQRRNPVSELAEEFAVDLHPLLRRVYAARGVRSPQELDRRLGALLPAEQMDGTGKAADLLAEAVMNNKRVLIVGDFDCDGATSVALGMLALRAMGCGHVDYLVPNRFDYGYGLTPEIVELARQGSPDLIVTVDNGISSIEGVAAANDAGIAVIVTDHHLPGEVLPDAAAIVNPSLPGNRFPSKATAGVGVIFYLLVALRSRLRSTGWFQRQSIPQPNMADYLDLVALGTVADVVPLDANNRILVYQGLNRIRGGRCRPGITALLEMAGRQPGRTRASDLGFAVGPRLNAAGRLDDMSLGIECLLADTPATARQLATHLDRLNRERRQIEDDMRRQAMEMLESRIQEQSADLAWGLCLFDEGWHQGVIGILASRIKDRYHRPVIAFAGGDGNFLKGSARSIPGLHIRDALDEVATRSPGLLNKFGGHAMAAGLTIEAGRLEDFRTCFDEVVRRYLEPDDLAGIIHSDGSVPVASLNLDTARLIADAGPWGQSFPEPLFDDFFQVVSQRILKEKHWKLVLKPEGAELMLDAIGFNLVEGTGKSLPERVHAAYRLDVNEYRGNISLQLKIEYLEIA